MSPRLVIEKGESRTPRGPIFTVEQQPDGSLKPVETVWAGVWNVDWCGGSVSDRRGMRVNCVTKTLGTAEDVVASFSPAFARRVRNLFDRGQRLANTSKIVWYSGAVIFPLMALCAYPLLLLAGQRRAIALKYAISEQ